MPAADSSPERSGEPVGRVADRAESVVIVLVTGPDRDTLLDIGRTVVRERLAACLNLMDVYASVYRWKGDVVEEPEAMGWMKTTESQVEPLMRRVRELHPYEEPELLVLPLHSGAPSYLAWVADSVGEE